MSNYRTNFCRRRCASLLLGMVLLACVLGGTAVVLLEMGHECSGEDCPVCHLVELASDALALVKPPNPPTVASVLPTILAGPLLKYGCVTAHASSLVKLKIRLNN